MIAKAILMKTAVKSHFAKLVAYITDDQDTPFRLGAVNITNCYGDEVEDAVFEVLNTQLKNQRAISDKTYHLIVSFRAGEEPNAETLKAIEQEICIGLGFKGHQRVSAVHCDTENLHIHIAINKVHPSKHTIHNPFQDYKTLAKLCAKLEQQYGLEVDNHSTQRNHTAGRAGNMEAHAGIESLISWIQNHALAQIKQANSWKALHITLYENGLSIKPRGNGLAISTLDGSVGVKASSVARELAKGKLEQRLGEFLVANEDNLAQCEVKQRYKRKPIDNQNQAHQTKNQARHKQQSGTYQPTTINSNTLSNTLYAQYRQQMAEKTDFRNQALAIARLQHQTGIQRAKEKAADKRRWIKALISPGLNKRLLLSLLGKGLQSDIMAINARYKEQRQRLFNQHRRLAWLDWLQQEAKQGNPQALQLLRQRHITQDQRGNSLSRSRYSSGAGHNAQNTANAFPHKLYKPEQAIANVTKQGTVFYLHDHAVIKDDGNRFHLAADASQETITAALIQAKQRHGYRLSVQGSEMFQENVVRVSVQAGLNISFEQDHLERRRVQLSAELHLFGKGAVNQLADKQKISWQR
jgi:hypothetical protein